MVVVVIIRVDCCGFFQFDSVELRWMKSEIEKKFLLWLEIEKKKCCTGREIQKLGKKRIKRCVCVLQNLEE